MTNFLTERIKDIDWFELFSYLISDVKAAGNDSIVDLNCMCETLF